MRNPLVRLSFAIGAVAAAYLAVSLDPPNSCTLSLGTVIALVLLPLAGVSLVLAVIGFLLDTDDGPLAPLSLVVLLGAAALLGGCSQQSFADRYKNEDAFARRYLELVRTGEKEQARALLVERYRDDATDKVLDQLAGALGGEPREVDLIGLQSNEAGTLTNVDLDYQIHHPKGYVLVSVRVISGGGEPRVGGFHLSPVADDLRRVNAFTLAGKGVAQYAALATELGIIGIVIFALVRCATTPNLRRKWLWMVFIGVGACKLFFNWTTGVVSVAPLSLQLPPFGFVRGSEYAPMLLFVTFPLGALVFLLRRPALVRVPKTLADPTASECRTVSEARE